MNNNIESIMGTRHVATITAYERKDGGFRARMRTESTKEIHESGILSTLEEARHYCKDWAYKNFQSFKLAPIYRKGEYFANVWVRA